MLVVCVVCVWCGGGWGGQLPFFWIGFLLLGRAVAMYVYDCVCTVWGRGGGRLLSILSGTLHARRQTLGLLAACSLTHCPLPPPPPGHQGERHT